jgi:uncharacterized protein YcfJ
MHILLRTIACLSLATALVTQSSTVNARSLFAYPMKGQSLEQENRDRRDCHNWAVQQTGFRPSGVPEERRGRRGARRGGVRGGLGGTLVGAIAGGSSGAAVGLGVGALAGGLIGGVSGSNRQRDLDAQHDAYLRAGQACLEGRGYRVSR